MSISIKLRDDAERRLVEIAKQLNVRAEDLAAAAVGDLITPSDEAFQSAAARVLTKNRDLYQRLA